MVGWRWFGFVWFPDVGVAAGCVVWGAGFANSVRVWLLLCRWFVYDFDLMVCCSVVAERGLAVWVTELFVCCGGLFPRVFGLCYLVVGGLAVSAA